MTPHDLTHIGIHVFERGWLSSNNILCIGANNASIVDTGYVDHAEQTMALVQHALRDRPLDHILNTHLHSDHCGGNARLQEAHPNVHTRVPAPSLTAVRNWDTARLTFERTGQECPRFAANASYGSGDTLWLGDRQWEVHAAPGHDPEAMLIFEPQSRTLLSADALWENGLGVIFPELDGEPSFEAAEATIDLIASLNPAVVIPGHGALFSDVAAAIARARRRIDSWAHAPDAHYAYGLKVLVKYKLLSAQRITVAALSEWANQTPYLTALAPTARRIFGLESVPTGSPADISDTMAAITAALVRSGAARTEGDWVINVS